MNSEREDRTLNDLPGTGSKSAEIRRRELLEEYRKLPDVNPDQPEESVLIELETEADASDFASETLEICWQRSIHVMPCLRIVTELEEYLVPWVHVALIKSDRSRKLIEIHTSFGIVFHIQSRLKQDHLFALLQLQRVKVIYPVEGVAVKAVAQQNAES